MHRKWDNDVRSFNKIYHTIFKIKKLKIPKKGIIGGMDIFKEVRERANILKVCDVLGIKLDRNYKSLCPFPNHREKTPSFSISPSKNIFYCFRLSVKNGNSITLVQELLNISPLEAAKFINIHLGLGIDTNSKVNYAYINNYNRKRRAANELEKQYNEWENKTFQKLCDYLHLLETWKEIKNPENELYIKALTEIDKIDYYIDFFIYGTKEDKLWFKKTNGKVVEKLWTKK